MRINAISTSPQFKSNVKYVNSSQGETLFYTKTFKEFVNRIANNGETSTVVLLRDYPFSSYEQQIKDRVTGKFTGYKGMHRVYYVFHPEKIRKGEDPFVPEKEDIHFKRFFNMSSGLDIYIVKEIDGKPHIGVSRVPFEEHIDFADYRYKCAESNMPDHPIPDWMDKRLYKYLAPTSDSRVMLLYSGLYGQDTDDLYKNEDFINCVEWLDKEFINKYKEAQIIIRPISKFPSGSYYMGVYMIKPSLSDHNKLAQYGDTICWCPNDYKPYDKLKERIEMELSESKFVFPNLLELQQTKSG